MSLALSFFREGYIFIDWILSIPIGLWPVQSKHHLLTPISIIKFFDLREKVIALCIGIIGEQIDRQVYGVTSG